MESAWRRILTLLYFFLICAQFCFFLELPKNAMKVEMGPWWEWVWTSWEPIVVKKPSIFICDFLNLWWLCFLSKQKPYVLLKRHLKAKQCNFGKWSVWPAGQTGKFCSSTSMHRERVNPSHPFLSLRIAWNIRTNAVQVWNLCKMKNASNTFCTQPPAPLQSVVHLLQRQLDTVKEIPRSLNKWIQWIITITAHDYQFTSSLMWHQFATRDFVISFFFSDTDLHSKISSMGR